MTNQHAGFWPAALLCALLALCLGGCSLLGIGGEKPLPEESESTGGEEYPVGVGGVYLLERPERIVSLAPALTEKICDLGGGDRLAGISDYCDYPGAITDRRPCGTAQIPDVETIKALSPQVVVTEAALSEEATALLEEAGIPVAVFPHAGSVDELVDTYTELGKLLEGEIAGATLGSGTGQAFFGELQTLFERLDAYTGQNGQKKALYLRLLDQTAATGDTFDGELLRVICVENVAENYSDWTLPLDSMGTDLAELASADVIFLDRAFITLEDLQASALYSGLPAVLHGRCYYISSIALERQSMRTIQTLTGMAAAVYPDAMPGDAVPAESAGPATDTSADSAGGEPEETESGEAAE